MGRGKFGRVRVTASAFLMVEPGKLICAAIGSPPWPSPRMSQPGLEPRGRENVISLPKNAPMAALAISMDRTGLTTSPATFARWAAVQSGSLLSPLTRPETAGFAVGEVLENLMVKCGLPFQNLMRMSAKFTPLL